MMSSRTTSVLAVALFVLAPGASGTSVEFSTSNLSQGPALDNVKAAWGTTVNVKGQAIKVSAAYDMKAKSDFIKEATVAGSISPVNVALTQNFASGVSKLALSAKAAGVTFKSVMTSKMSSIVESAKLNSITAVKTANIGPVDLCFEPSFAVSQMVGSVRLLAEYSLGLGATLATDMSVTTEGAYDVDVDISYAGNLEGRPVSAVVKPLGKAAKLEVKDSQLGVVTATYTLGGTPKVTAKRAFSF